MREIEPTFLIAFGLRHFGGLTAVRHFSKMTALGVASRCSRAPAACLRRARSPDALVASTIIGGAILFLCDPAENQRLDVDTLFALTTIHDGTHSRRI